MDKYNLFTNEDDLSTRSLNILKKLGGIKEMLNHFKKYGSFTNITNSGKNTNKELSSFCEYLIEKGNTEQFNFEEKENRILFPSENAVINDSKQLVEGYFILKSDLSTRAKNVLTILENENQFNLDDVLKVNFIKTYIIEDFSFSKIKNIGLKTLSELVVFKREIQRIAFTNLLDESEININNLRNKLFRLLSQKISKEEVSKLIDENHYCFQKVMAAYIFNLRLPERQKNVLHICYYSEGSYTLNSVAEKTDCTRERVRQIVHNLETRVIPKAVRYVLNGLKDVPSDLSFISDKHILDLENFSYFNLDSIDYTPNHLLSRCVYDVVLKKEYLQIDKAIHSSGENIISFSRVKTCFFISKKFIEITHFSEFINWIDFEIYNFTIAEFEFDTKVLIQRFYRENNIEVSKSILDELYFIIEKTKKTDWSDIKGAITKGKKKNIDDSALDLCYEFLKLSSKSQTTGTLLEHLNSNYLEIHRARLLSLLNKNKNRFKRLVNGYWTLKESDTSISVSGSLRDIVREKLQNCSEPLHVSEILEFLNVFHKTNEKSLMTNLKVDGTFRIFNCSYIGLASIKYDQYWSDLPIFRAWHLNKSTLEFKNVKSSNQIANYLFSEYGYPQKHILFLLSQRKKAAIFERKKVKRSS